ncbi:uncharacterized protein [Physcomitrium patens]|uniref:Coiled-coil SMC6 And NSE5 INteracting (CANIN) domain-containing protein n=1 Tax=Physcomitrium patens TaxID=3218 RepID=A0A2K1KMI4_PHYPA|nr:uncharacterized protein LOC112281289 [Physcomitrium patens]PNR54983.1 hypothetical protein PHYPA_005876 [Physcomitrium patens]|eukprot:XP_024373405.1 uncharacterized protein LOC112281289 [Physcomitrella patens]
MESLTTEDEEDWLRLPLSSTKPAVEPPEVHAKKRQKKVVTLDDLVQDDLKKKPKAKSNKLVQKLKAKAHLYSYSDEEGEENLRAPKLLEELEKQVTNGIGEEVEPEWGQEVFRAQLEPPSTPCGGTPSLHRALQALEGEGRETSLEGLARSGFLRAWALCTKRCDESTLRWTYHQMAYSIDESLERCCCKFLSDLVSRISTDSGALLEMEWLPNLSDIKETLTVYGYMRNSRDFEDTHMDSSSESIVRGPLKNLRSILEFIATLFVTRHVQPYYSVVDIESLLVIMVHLSLARELLGILDKVQDCILALIRYFSPEEWSEVCPRVTVSISDLTEGVHNGVFLLGMFSGLGKRSVDMQRRLALHELSKLARRKRLLATSREVASLFENVNLKGKVVDFGKLYYQVVIADIFLWCNEGPIDEVARSIWIKFLGLCSRQIYIGDERAFATKLRNTASFLMQKYEHESHDIEISHVKAADENFQ